MRLAPDFACLSISVSSAVAIAPWRSSYCGLAVSIDRDSLFINANFDARTGLLLLVGVNSEPNQGDKQKRNDKI
jgi:hypothetical protein